MREPEHIIQAPTSDPEPARSQHRGESLTKEQQVLAAHRARAAPQSEVAGRTHTMAHGAGGRATATLIEALFLEAFRNRCWRPSRIQAVSAGGRAPGLHDGFVCSLTPVFPGWEHRRPGRQRDGQ